jgi:prolyl-tRNA synthetase
LVRGDMEVNETKLSNALRARWLRPADAEAIAKTGAVAGYASPIGLSNSGLIVAADDLVISSANLVSGANETGYHYRNVNAGRDFQPGIVADLASAFEGAPCPDCGATLRLTRGVEVGNIFQLGTRYTEALGATYLDGEGLSHPVVMGSYGIGIGRLLACIAEEYNDDRGLRLPLSVAPYAVHLVRLSAGDAGIEQQADELYEALQSAGIETLYDDRAASPGVKFADADLLGMPIRVTLSARSLKNGGVELKRRDGASTEVVPTAAAVSAIRALMAALSAETIIPDHHYPGAPV